MKNFKNVYRDAFGKAQYDLESTLETYFNQSMIKESYSYDTEHWFNSTQEAEEFELRNLNIQSSLYYKNYGLFYNAFNTEDIKSLLNTFPDGYYLNKVKNLAKTKDINLKSDGSFLYKNFWTLLKKKLSDDFKDDYLQAVTDIKNEKVSYWELTIPFLQKNHEIRIRFPHEEVRRFKRGEDPEMPVLKFENESDKEYFNSAESDSKWYRGREYCFLETYRYYLDHDFSLFNPKTKRFEIAKVQIYPHTPNIFSSNYASIGNMTCNWEKKEQIIKNTINVYLDSQKQQEIFSRETSNTAISQLKNDEVNRIYDNWFDEYAKTRAFQFKEDKKLELEDLKNNKVIENIDGGIFKDKLYSPIDTDLTFKNLFSVRDSYSSYQELKTKILQKPVIESGIEKYKLQENFYATKDQLDNFLYLQGRKTKLKYSIGLRKNQTSFDGKLLFDTPEQARIFWSQNRNLFLKKKYTIHNLFDYKIVEGFSKEDLQKKISNIVQLKSKYVHKKEIPNNDSTKVYFDQLISSGIYDFYRLKNLTTNEYINFLDEESALKSIMNFVKKGLKRQKYFYTYFDKKNNKEYSTIFYDNDFENPLKEILRQINAN